MNRQLKSSFNSLSSLFSPIVSRSSTVACILITSSYYSPCALPGKSARYTLPPPFPSISSTISTIPSVHSHAVRYQLNTRCICYLAHLPPRPPFHCTRCFFMYPIVMSFYIKRASLHRLIRRDLLNIFCINSNFRMPWNHLVLLSLLFTNISFIQSNTRDSDYSETSCLAMRLKRNISDAWHETSISRELDVWFCMPLYLHVCVCACQYITAFYWLLM